MASAVAAAGVIADTEISIETVWSKLNDLLFDAVTKVYGLSKKHQWGPETWWSNEHVDEVIQEKQAQFKTYKALHEEGWEDNGGQGGKDRLQ